MSTLLFPDTIGDIRTWLRGLTSLSSLTSGRVFLRIPDGPLTYPLIRLTRTGGAVQPGETPVQDIRLSIEVFGGQPSDYATVSQTARTLESELHTLTGPVGSGTYVLNAQVGAVLDAPDPDTGAARIVLDVLVTVRTQ